MFSADTVSFTWRAGWDIVALHLKYTAGIDLVTTSKGCSSQILMSPYKSPFREYSIRSSVSLLVKFRFAIVSQRSNDRVASTKHELPAGTHSHITILVVVSCVATRQHCTTSLRTTWFISACALPFWNVGWPSSCFPCRAYCRVVRDCASDCIGFSAWQCLLVHLDIELCSPLPVLIVAR